MFYLDFCKGGWHGKQLIILKLPDFRLIGPKTIFPSSWFTSDHSRLTVTITVSDESLLQANIAFGQLTYLRSVAEFSFTELYKPVVAVPANHLSRLASMLQKNTRWQLHNDECGNTISELTNNHNTRYIWYVNNPVNTSYRALFYLKFLKLVICKRSRYIFLRIFKWKDMQCLTSSNLVNLHL